MSLPTPPPITEESAPAVALQFLFRLLRLTALHAMDNQAVRQALPQTLQLIHRAAKGGSFTVTFAGEAVWVNGRLLKAPRQAYELCRQVGAVLERAGVNQLAFRAGVTEAELGALMVRLNGDAPAGAPLEAGHIQLRRVDIKLPTALSADAGASAEQVVRLYSAAVVLTQRLVDQFREGRYELFRHVKRLSHRLILHAGTSPRALQALATGRGARRDDASRAVNSALLALLAAGLVTQERRVLLRVVMGALVLDLGRARAAGLMGASSRKLLRLALELSDEEKDRLPDATAFLFLSVGHQTSDALCRATILFEAQALARQEALGAPYGGVLDVSLEAGLISVARRLVDLVANAALTGPMTFSEAALELAPTLPSATERRCLALVLRAADIPADPDLVTVSP